MLLAVWILRVTRGQGSCVLCSGRADGAADWWLYMRHLAVLETLATRASAGNKMVIIILFDHTTHTSQQHSNKHFKRASFENRTDI